MEPCEAGEEGGVITPLDHQAGGWGPATVWSVWSERSTADRGMEDHDVVSSLMQ